MFCAHHAREHADKIQQVASSVQDDTGRLAAPKAASADES
jgi:hypothetical protein